MKQYIRVSDVAKRLKVTNAAVYKWIKLGKLQVEMIGGYMMIDPVEFRRFSRKRGLQT